MEANNNIFFNNRRLFSLLWPLIIEQLLSVLVGMIDVLMVSFLGEETVSGVSLVDSINHLIIQVLFALTTGGTVICAQFIGKKDEKTASKSGAQMILITIAGMIVITCVFLLGGKPILSLLFGGVEPGVMKAASKYMWITAFSFPMLAIYHSTAAVFRAKGNTRISMFVSLGMNLLNIGGNALCIFGFGMDVAGVAIPTLVARTAGAVTMIVLLQKIGGELRIRSLKDFRPRSSLIKNILAIGIPGGVESSLFNVGKIILQSLISTLGTSSIAAFAVASNLVTYLYLPGNAVGAAMTTIVAQCYGAGEHILATKYVRKLILVNYAMLVVICSVMIIGSAFWVGCYHLQPESAVIGRQLLIAHSVAMVLWPPAFLLPYYYRAVGMPKFTMAVSLSIMAVFRVGLAYLFVKLLHHGVLWVWYAMFIDWVVRNIVYIGVFEKRKRKLKENKL